jgi:hypothetical protein
MRSLLAGLATRQTCEALNISPSALYPRDWARLSKLPGGGPTAAVRLVRARARGDPRPSSPTCTCVSPTCTCVSPAAPVRHAWSTMARAWRPQVGPN